MEQKIMVSVVIPVYNAERFIETAIQSVLRQNAKWVELVLVDDGSKDHSAEICRKYTNDLVQCVSIDNAGAGHARNVGMERARGKWILFLDSDDLVLGNFFNKDLLGYFNKMLQNGTDIIYTPKIVSDYFLLNHPVITYPEPLEQIMHYIPSIEFWSCIYRADFLRQNHIRFFEYQKQDVESAFRFRAFSKANDIKIEPRRIYYVHRDNPTSNVNTWNWDRVLETKAKVYYNLFQEFDKPEYETKNWLYLQSLYYTKELLSSCWRQGFLENEQQQVAQLLDLYALPTREEREVKLPVRYRVLERVIRLMQRRSNAWKLFCRSCEKKQRGFTPAPIHTDQPVDDMPMLFERLNVYEEFVRKDIANHCASEVNYESTDHVSSCREW